MLVSFRITKNLPVDFSGSVHVSNCGLNGCEDTEIWNYAKKNNLAIVTFDSDFFDISLIHGHPPKIIWIRTGNLTTSNLIELLVVNGDKIHAFLLDEDYLDIACLELEI